jgi:hypothetical protein
VVHVLSGDADAEALVDVDAAAPRLVRDRGERGEGRRHDDVDAVGAARSATALASTHASGRRRSSSSCRR